jgi:hypothetical protein
LNGISLSAADYASILMPRLKTLHTSTEPITYTQVKASLSR